MKPLTIEGIEKEFAMGIEKEFAIFWKQSGYFDKNIEPVKEFYRSKISEMLESLRMEEMGGEHPKSHQHKRDFTGRYDAGYNQAVSKFNKKLDTLKGGVGK